MARVNPFDEQFLNLFHVPGGPTLDTDGTVNFVTNQHNDEQQSPLLSSIIPQSLIPPSVGACSDLTTYIHDPTSHQPSKKAYQGVNAASTVTAAFSTSFAASPTQISIYTNKRNASNLLPKVGLRVPRALLICLARMEVLLKFYPWKQLIASSFLSRPQSSPILPVPPEALPKFYRQIQLITSLCSILP